MKNLDQLKKQHVEIEKVIKETKQLISKKDLEIDAQVIARNINNIAGKLKVHLNSEDKFLYPAFLECDNEELRNKAKAYTNEMGNLSSVYNEFKNKYNTRSKIMADTNSFVLDSEKVFKAIEKRINKEDDDLYKIAERL